MTSVTIVANPSYEDKNIVETTTPLQHTIITDNNIDPFTPLYMERDASNQPLYKIFLKEPEPITGSKTTSEADTKTTSKAPENKEPVIMQALAGVGVQVVLEFPTNDHQSSVYFTAKDFITVSYSVARSKMPVILLGNSSMSGMALGTKMIAGSIVKLFGRYDSVSNYIRTFVATRWDSASPEFKSDMSSIQSNITFKEFSDYMRDDISPFNIHFIHTTELPLDTDYISNLPQTEEHGYAPRVSSIIGATIINNGNVFSVENLITEETLSFIAKTVVFDSDNIKPERSNTSIMTGSQLLGIR